MATEPSGSEAMFWAGVEHAGKFFELWDAAQTVDPE